MMGQKTILILGEQGQVARAFQERDKEKNFDIVFPEDSVKVVFAGQRVVNFIETTKVIEFIEFTKPDIIINTAAYTAVDKAESEPEVVDLINHQTPAAVAQWTKINNKRLIHFSSDYVFDGVGEKAWDESSAPNPLSVYGKSKLMGDKAIIQSGGNNLIVRTSWVYSNWGQNFFRTMIRLGREREELSIVNDQIGSPTFAPDLVAVLFQLISHPKFQQHKGSEVYNICGTGHTSWYDFAIEIFRLAHQSGMNLKVKKINPIPTSAYPTQARRPLNSRLSQEKLKKDFSLEMPIWKASLVSAFKREN